MSWRRFFRRSSSDGELVQEIDLHLAEEIDDNVAQGMGAEEARRRAFVKFGNPTRLREEMWKMNSVAPFEDLLRNVRYSWRVLRRNPGYALLAILTLGLGIGANTAIFTVINGVLLRPLPYADPGQIVHLDLTATKLGPDPLGLSVQEVRASQGAEPRFFGRRRIPRDDLHFAGIQGAGAGGDGGGVGQLLQCDGSEAAAGAAAHSCG